MTMAWSSTFILCVAHGSRCRVKPPASPVSQMHLAAMYARPTLLELASPSICEGLRFRQGDGQGRWLTVENDGQLGLVSVRHLFRPVELAGATRRLRRLTGDETPYLSSSRVPNRHSRSASKLAPRLCRCGPLPTLRNGVYRLAFGAMLPIVVALYGELDCQPTPLYRGDSVEAWVHGPHAFGGPSCCPQSRMHKPVPHGRSLWACRSLGALAQCEVEESSPTENGLRGLLVEGACLRGWAGRPGHSGRSWSSSSFATTENPVRVP